MRKALFSGKTLTAAIFFSVAVALFLSLATAALASTAQCEPQVAQSSPTAYWSSYKDYLEHRLTVDESLENTGGCVPCLLRIAEVEASQGVTVQTPMPLEIGNLAPSAIRNVRLQFMVPLGVASFRSHLRVVCGPLPPQPVSSSQFRIEPPVAWANEGCPVPPPEMSGLAMPADQAYGPRVFTATLRDENGNPVAGKALKWRLSDPVGFRIIQSSGVTDENGQTAALVTPPQYFVCIVPYFDRGMTIVSAVTDDGRQAGATFVYSRCAPVGATPPWAGLT